MNKLSRRDIVRLLALGAFSALSPEVLAGCGGGGGGSSPSGGGGHATTPGSVDTSQIGGRGLVAHSGTDQGSMVSTAGAFNTTASRTGAQLLAVSDNANQLRALAIANPGNTSPLTVNATLTAIALLMLTPGILTTNSAEASTRETQLTSLTGFPALQSYLKANLQSSSLQSLLAQSALAPLVSACITEYLATYTSNARPRETSQDGSFTATFASSSTPTSATVNLSNAGWRWVQIARQPLDANGNPLGSATLANTPTIPLLGNGYLAGAMAATWGSIFTGIGSPTVASDTGIDLTNPDGQSMLEYFADGLGFASSSATFPLSASVAPIGLTIISYCLFPVLDLILGGESLLNDAAIIPQLWSDLEEGLNLNTLLNASGVAEIEGAILDLVIGAIGIIAGSSAILGLLGLTPAAVFLTFVSIFLAGFNFTVAALDLAVLPSVSTVSLTDSGVTVTVS